MSVRTTSQKTHVKSRVHKTLTVFSLLLFVSVFLVACSGNRPVNTQTTDFYTGTRGVTTTFEQIPTRLFFYRDPGVAGNEFEIGIEVKNEGASWTRGAVFLSGYDPNLLRFDEIPLVGFQAGACGVSIGSIGFGEFGGIFSCDDFTIGGTSLGDFFFDIQSIRSFIDGRGWDGTGFDFSVSGAQFGDSRSFTLNFNNPAFNRDYWGHGRLLIAMFSRVDFRRVLGTEFEIPGRSYEYPAGGSDYISFNGEVLGTGWPPGLDDIRQSIMLTTCYMYATTAAPLVCIDSDPYSNHQKVCNVGQLSFGGSQGAPVAITSVEQEAGPRSSSFRINIQNVGRGEVYDVGMIEKCSPYYGDRVRPSDKNVVYVQDVRIGNTRLQNCVPNGGVVRLQNGRGTITCTYPYEYAGSQNAYETPLYVELWYGYSETQQRDILIKRVQ